jgi:arylsulfatase A-like enzyme
MIRLFLCLFLSLSLRAIDSPNIIVVDLGYAELFCTGVVGDISTTNIDRLAKEGTRFPNASSVAIMTGVYQQWQDLVK